MRPVFVGILFQCLFSGLACQGASQEDPCRGVVCREPPGSTCRDENTLLEYSPTGVCDPQTGQCTYASQERHCYQGCRSGLCDGDPGDDFAILSPPDARMCTTHHHQDPFQEIRSKGILTFQEGFFRLPRDQEAFDLEWIDSVEISPGQTLEPRGPGMFTRTINGDPEVQASYDYLYRKDYDLGGQVFQLTVRASFLVTGGVCESPVITVDDGRCLIENCSAATPARGESLEWQSDFTTCQFENRDLFTPTRIEVEMQNGDRINFHLRLAYACCCLPLGDWAELVMTEFIRGEQQLLVTDFFMQAFSAQHHIFGQSLLALLDPPADEIHGLLMHDADGPEPSLEYLDADLNPLATPEIASVQIISGQ